MTITVLYPDKIMASFPHSTLPKISSETHHQSFFAMRDAIKENYLSIPFRRGGGTYVYLRGLLSYTVYGTIAMGNAFVTPPNPVPLVIPT